VYRYTTARSTLGRWIAGRAILAKIPVLLTLALAIPTSVYADTPPTPTVTPAPQLVEHGTYVNKDGVVVHSPAHTTTGAAPTGATAKCRDGTFSFSLHHRGTCSHHGGVSSWLN